MVESALTPKEHPCISDWITFLSSEKFGFISTMLGLGSIIIAISLILGLKDVGFINKLG